MEMLKIVKQAGPDRVIHLSIPVDEAAQRYRLTVTIEPESTSAEGIAADSWPLGYLDRVVGAWEGDFEVCDEGDFEKREAL